MKLKELYDKAYNLIGIGGADDTGYISRGDKPVFVNLQNGSHAEVIDINDTGIIISIELEKMDKAQIDSHTNYKCTKCGNIHHIAHMYFVEKQLMCFACKAEVILPLKGDES
jgi:hypothetical protein